MGIGSIAICGLHGDECPYSATDVALLINRSTQLLTTVRYDIGLLSAPFRAASLQRCSLIGSNYGVAELQLIRAVAGQAM